MEDRFYLDLVDEFEKLKLYHGALIKKAKIVRGEMSDCTDKMRDYIDGNKEM